MIDWIGRLPDGAIALGAIASAWFGFNYAVLGERAMVRDLHAPTLAACSDELMRKGSTPPTVRSGIGELFGLPQLDALEAKLVERVLPPVLLPAQASARCACAVAAASSALRFDYAVHTASFRSWPVEQISSWRSDVMSAASGSACGGIDDENL
ncbi:hypothetical protein [Roseovarius sp.]|uniref:hypothetical protein n=1 Tax=Roseovarius sp. TaxID=1486281 RepID=UPI003A972475